MKASILFLGILAIVSSAPTQAKALVRENEPIHTLCREGKEVIEKRAYGPYQIEIISAGDKFCQALEIKERGRSIYEKAEIGTHFYFGDEVSKQGRAFPILAEKDRRNLVVSEWTGGAHCCFFFHIFELEGGFRKIGEIYGGDNPPEFSDLNGDGVQEIVIEDDALAEVFSCFALSATGRVVLKRSGDEYKVATEYMKKSAPGLNGYKRRIARWRKLLSEPGPADRPDWPPPPMIQAITDLYYSGNKKVAYQLLDAAWPNEVPGREAFLRKYERALMSRSLWYRDFERLSQGN